MSSMKKICLVLAIFLGVFFCRFALAAITINEVMYDPGNSSREWIELYNTGSSVVDLTGWRFFDDADTSVPIHLQNGSSALVPPLGYAVIAHNLTDFKTDWPDFNGMFFSASSFSLPDDSVHYNTYVGISAADKIIVDGFSYDTTLGGQGDTSLSKINNTWTSGVPTPAAVNQAVSSSPPPPDPVPPPTPTPSGANVPLVPAPKPPVVVPKIKTDIVGDSVGFVGIPVHISLVALNPLNEPLASGKFFVNFGDGDSKEIRASDDLHLTHTYSYEGEYTVTSEYYQNMYTDIPTATDTITMKIVLSNILITAVGNDTDFFVELSNVSEYDIDLSKWLLQSGSKRFLIPKNTEIRSKQKLRFSPKITGFSTVDTNDLALFAPDMELISKFSYPVVHTKTTVASRYIPATDVISASNEETDIATRDISAGAAAAETNSTYGFIFWVSIFVGLVGVASFSAWFLRRRSIASLSESAGTGSDFEVLDE